MLSSLISSFLFVLGISVGSFPDPIAFEPGLEKPKIAFKLAALQKKPVPDIHKIWIFRNYEPLENSVCTKCEIKKFTLLDLTDPTFLKISSEDSLATFPYKIEHDIIKISMPDRKASQVSFKIEKVTERELELILIMDVTDGNINLKGNIVKAVFTEKEN